jgi:hypothetical protein
MLDAGLVLTALLGTAMLFACFSLAALVSRRRRCFLLPCTPASPGIVTPACAFLLLLAGIRTLADVSDTCALQLPVPGRHPGLGHQLLHDDAPGDVAAAKHARHGLPGDICLQGIKRSTCSMVAFGWAPVSMAALLGILYPSC